MTEFGFYKYKTWFCYDTTDLFIGVKTDKSNYSELYYINFGIFVKRRWHNDEYINKNPDEAEIRARLDYCEIEKIDVQAYETYLKQKIAYKFTMFNSTDSETKLKNEIQNNLDDFVLIMPINERKL